MGHYITQQQYTVIEGNEKILPVENNIALLIGTKIGLVVEDFFYRNGIVSYKLNKLSYSR